MRRILMAFLVLAVLPACGSGGGSNSPPIILRQIPDTFLDWTLSSPTSQLDLGTVFTDAEDGPFLLYSVVGNTSPAVSGVTVNNLTGILSVPTGSAGVTIITLRATDSGGLSVEQSFQLTVASTTFTINEILANPGTVDANGDGTVNVTQDEFVEITNNGPQPADLAGWTLSVSSIVRLTFPTGTVVPNGGAVVVFGGGVPVGTFGGSVIRVATHPSGLGLPDGGGTVRLSNGFFITDEVSYGAATAGVSFNRSPEVIGSSLILHNTVAGNTGNLSPGTKVNGTTFP
jgi:hypothetical protein